MRRGAVGPDRQANLDAVAGLLRAVVFQGLRGRLVVGVRPVMESRGRGDGQQQHHDGQGGRRAAAVPGREAVPAVETRRSSRTTRGAEEGEGGGVSEPFGASLTTRPIL